MITLEEAIEAVNSLPFPEVNEGDKVWYPGKIPGTDDLGYEFVYKNGKWISETSQ